MERALRLHGKPDIFNTDRGSQYTGAAFTGVLKDYGIRISMDGKERAMENIIVERLWRSLKYEDIYLRDYETVEDLIQGLRRYFEYNNERPHQGLKGRTPAEVYRGKTLEKAAWHEWSLPGRRGRTPPTSYGWAYSRCPSSTGKKGTGIGVVWNRDNTLNSSKICLNNGIHLSCQGQ